MESELFVAQLPVLLEQSAAQHRLRRQPSSSGLRDTAPAQVAQREVLHHQPGVLVAHSQVVQAHDVWAVDALRDLVFLQKAPKRIQRC